MSNGLEPGGLAIVIHDEIPDNLGKVCVVGEFKRAARDGVLYEGFSYWYVASYVVPGSLWCRISAGGLVGRIDGKPVPMRELMIPAAWLMPLKGDAHDTHTTEEQKTPIEA